MTAAGDRRPSPNAEPLQGLESPFLDPGLFARQGAEERQVHLGALEAESAFLSAFEQPWSQPSLGEAESAEGPEDTFALPDEPVLSGDFGFEDSGVLNGDNRPEASDQGREGLSQLDSSSEEESTANFEGEAAEPEYEYEKVPETFPADAFVHAGDDARYFNTFPQLGDLLIVRKALILTPSNFESLMDHLLGSNQKSFVIVAHGNPLGLYMPLAEKTEVSPVKQSLFILRGIEHVRGLMRLAEESDTIWERASGTSLDSWRRIVEVMHSKTWRTMLAAPTDPPGPRLGLPPPVTWPTQTPRVPDVDAARNLVQSLLTALINALFPGKVADRQARVDTIIQKMLQLQARNIREIQFRACRVGADPVTLYEFRKFFGADHLCAPDVRSGFGSAGRPRIGRREVDDLAKRRLTEVYDLPGGRFAICIEVSGEDVYAACAADSQAAVGEWVASHMMTSSRYRTGALPIHFVLTRPPAFALDTGYAAEIRCHSSLWEGAIRAHELEEREAHQGAENETEDETGTERV